MTVLGIIALISGIAGVLLTIKQSIWCWPMALISVVTSGIEFYESRLFGDMALQVFYFISGVYGWVYWQQKISADFKVTSTPIKLIIPLILITVIQSIIYYYLLNYFKGDQVIFDSILTACSITVTYMMTKKWIENWIFWIIIDTAYVVLYLIKDLPLYSILYLLFAVMAFIGFIKWRKIKS